jgi:hypothetical protein
MSKQFGYALGVIFAICLLFALGFASTFLLSQNEMDRSRQTTITAIYQTNTSVAIAIAATETAKPWTPTPGVPGNRADNSAKPIMQERIVIKNASLRIVVANTGEALNNISKLAQEMGGWVVTSNTFQSGSVAGTAITQGSITIRVDAVRFNDALQRIKAAALSIENETVSGQDVTQDYVDLQSRVANLESAEAQLRKIMDSASQTSDVLSVYRELVSVRGEIEVARGRMQYFKEAAAFSSIEVALSTKPEEKVIEVAGWRPLETAQKALTSLMGAVQGIIDILIWLVVYVLPLVIVFGVPSWLIYRAINRRARRRAAQIEELFASDAASDG